MHALVGIQSKRPVASVLSIQLSEIEPEPQSDDVVDKLQYRDVWEDAMPRELAGLKATITF